MLKKRCTECYRFGFNGKENDKDWGNQLIQDYGFRLYNPAIAKFLSFDPLAPDYPSLTPYQFASNSPIEGIDLDGLEHESTKITAWYKNGKPAQTTTTITDIIIFEDAHVPGLTDNLVPQVMKVNPFTIVTNEYTDYQNQKFSEQRSKEFINGLQQIEARQSNIFGNLYDISPLSDGAAVYNQAKVGNYGYATGLFLAAWLPGEIDNQLAKRAAGMPNSAIGGSRRINPWDKGPDGGGLVNCAGCMEAGDATLKGYPASALNHGVTSTDEILAHFGKKSWSTGNSISTITTRMKNLKEGATGAVFGYRGAGKVGHYFNVKKEDGVIKFLDFQKEGSSKMNSSDFEGFKDFWFINTTE